MCPRITLYFWSSWLHFLNVGITGVWYHIQLMWDWGSTHNFPHANSINSTTNSALLPITNLMRKNGGTGGPHLIHKKVGKRRKHKPTQLRWRCFSWLATTRPSLPMPRSQAPCPEKIFKGHLMSRCSAQTTRLFNDREGWVKMASEDNMATGSSHTGSDLRKYNL